jgi:hypothetical protein
VLTATMMLSAPPAVGSFKVFPTVIDLDRDAGRPASGTFSVSMRGEAGRRFAVDVQDVVQQPNGTYAYQEPSRSPFSASSWVTVSPRTFAGDRNRTQPVEYRVLIPRRAEPGDHITSLTVRRLAKESQATAEPIQAVSVRLDVRVAGAARPEAEIASLEAPGVAGDSPVDLSAAVRNTGNVALDFDHANPGSLSVASGSDRKANADFAGILYPGQTRLFQLSWSNPPLFGSYTARASVDAGARVVSESKSIFVVPWRQLGALILVGLSAVVLVIGARRRRART